MFQILFYLDNPKSDRVTANLISMLFGDLLILTSDLSAW